MQQKRLVRVVAALVRDGTKVLITQRPANSEFGGWWEFPGGKVEPGESDGEALRREISEEMGLQVDVGGIFHSNLFEYERFILDFHLYNCVILGGEIALIGISGFSWVEPGELKSFRFPPADVEAVGLIAGESSAL
ncbi:MAG TPA: (deoxy)nucleoside triphosphate pyrophosphohydrolase [Myxococcota bacterium]|nr:(deoxy)nucleoside triphosphate pyrophosphohydrolase [Myxococcota bacterium]HOH75662.1 (deoxy)nucleoside triphosphate pyrophosphohydrolase [Myxococcota bacterium]HPV03864.1 (deoxy)nucleoside triphosphate pyrophosphohydrolase [Myxococcota bacterium]